MTQKMPLKKPLDDGLKRRDFLALGGAAAAASLTGLPDMAWSKGALASLKVGDMEIKVLSDGYLKLPAKMLAPNVADDKRLAAMKAAGQEGDTFQSPINVTFVKTPKDLIMLDVGSGASFMSSAGKLGEALEEVEIDPGNITKVVYTHAHPDHLWGTIDDLDELTFPDADYYIGAAEFDWWMQDDVLKKLDQTRQSFGLGAQRNLKTIKDRLKMLKPGEDVVTGIRAVATHGHTPGHMSYEIGDSKGSVLVTGDALTHPVISFQHPDWQPENDQVKDQAVATRKKLLDKLASDKVRVIGYHLPAPGIGVVKKKDGAYGFEAAS